MNISALRKTAFFKLWGIKQAQLQIDDYGCEKKGYLTFKQAHNLHVCENIHSINGKCMSSTEVGRLPSNTAIMLFPNSSKGFPHAFILSTCGQSRSTLWFLTSSAAVETWTILQQPVNISHTDRGRGEHKIWNQQGLKKYPTSCCNQCRASPTCSSFSLTTMLSWIIFTSQPEHIVAGGREQLCRLRTCSEGSCCWGSVLYLCVVGDLFSDWWWGGARLKSLVYSGAYWFGSDWLRLWWSSTRVTEFHLQRGQQMVATGQSELCG